MAFETRALPAPATALSRAADLAAPALWRRRAAAGDSLFPLAADAYRAAGALTERRSPRVNVVL